MLLGGRAGASRRARLRLAVAVPLLLAVLGAGGVSAAPRGGDLLTVEGTGEHVRLEAYGASGSEVVRYRHGRELTVRFAVRNPGVLPLTLTELDPFPTVLGLLEPVALSVDGRQLPVTLGPRAVARVEVRARFDHCAYFTERAIDPYAGAQAGWRVLGVPRSGTIAYPDALLVRSPTIVDCPGRVLDRGAKQRNRDATITGRG